MRSPRIKTLSFCHFPKHYPRTISSDGKLTVIISFDYFFITESYLEWAEHPYLLSVSVIR